MLIRTKKLVTVSQLGTIEDAAMLIVNGKIEAIGKWDLLRKQYPLVQSIDFADSVITPSLVDCHTHLLEYAPTTLFPVTEETHLFAGNSLLFKSLASGITALGEQICGHPTCRFSITDYRNAVKKLPMSISFATTSITIGFSELAHFSSVTNSRKISREELVDDELIARIAQESDFPGENLFLNATPANFTADEVPRAGELVYTLEELKQIVTRYHRLGKLIGVHVAGKEGIEMALEAGVDVFHHAHGITDEQIEIVAKRGIPIIATPIGGTHVRPNSPEDIVKLAKRKIPVSISTDAYLPPHPDASWLPAGHHLYGPDSLMSIAEPSMQCLLAQGFNENEILALLTANPAHVLGKEREFGSLQVGMDANFLVVEGIPGLEITECEKIRCVYYQGRKVVDRGE